MAPTRAWPVLASDVFSWRGKPGSGSTSSCRAAPRPGTRVSAASCAGGSAREALERVVQPLVGGIYTADPDRLSLAATMPRFLALEREHRSLILGLRRGSRGREATRASGARWSLFVTLAGGMEELVTALAARLPAGAVRLAHAGGGRHAGSGRLAGSAGGRPAAATRTASSWPARRPAMGPLVSGVDPTLAARLDGIPYASSATVALAYPRAAIRHPLDGFGFVVPRGRGTADPGVHLLEREVSRPRAGGDSPSCACFVGGALQADLLAREDRALVALAEADVASLLGITGRPILSRRVAAPRAMPQYDVGHLDRVAAIEARLESLPGLALAGGAYRGVGIADCVRSGEAAAERLHASLEGTMSGMVAHESAGSAGDPDAGPRAWRSAGRRGSRRPPRFPAGRSRPPSTGSGR